MSQANQEIRLILPANQTYAPVAGLALSGLGMVLGLDIDLLGDLPTVTGECFDCLLHQSGHPQKIEMTAWADAGQLCVRFTAIHREQGAAEDELALEITRGVLETLMPQVALDMDEMGVRGIECSMPV